ncbi:uncharacterized protein LOC119072828 [Bradysia coprophila]|uniref:uncharacterized protein LOC119072828 n=1 Tax=Bradysia coprophila TaxID=38358 RepID=UPI00187D7A75|nr:uncharacterized protein LOC119072828 [Bradysia coprophila]
MLTKNPLILICMTFLSHRFLHVTARPDNFPDDIEINKEKFVNWSGDIEIDNVWVARPRTQDHMVDIANWAHQYGKKVRVIGFRHSFAPIGGDPQINVNETILVDPTKHLTKIEKATFSIPDIPLVLNIEAGATMESILTYAEEYGASLYHCPAPGELSIAGVVTVGAHGSGAPPYGEDLPPAFSGGTVSNAIVSLSAVVWNSIANKYVLETFDRSHPDTKDMIISLGRIPFTGVHLGFGKNYNLACDSCFTISSEELYKEPEASNGHDTTFSKIVNETGRCDILSFGTENKTWAMVWQNKTKQPFLSRHVKDPYNFIFNTEFHVELAELYSDVSGVAGPLVSLFAQTQHKLAFLLSLPSLSLWGKSKNTMLYVKPNTLREDAAGYAVITKRSHLQKVVSIINNIYNSCLTSYRMKNEYPMAGHLQFRVTGVDLPYMGRFHVPSLSPARQVPGYDSHDIVLWVAFTSQRKQPGLHRALSDIETRILNKFPMVTTNPDPLAFVRVEWSKGYAHTSEGGWLNQNVLKNVIPRSFPRDDWNRLVATLARLDEKNIFNTVWLDSLLQPY